MTIARYTLMTILSIAAIMSKVPSSANSQSASALTLPPATSTYVSASPTTDMADGWPMAGANPKRTSWTPEEVRGQLEVDWYRPIEAYISQYVQIIAAYGNLYLATARGLYVLDAEDGQVVWRYDTELPLGHSPTVADGLVYFGGFDKKLHALDALTGEAVWTFEGAQAGFGVNPLVIEDKVYAGNRDGYFYAVDAYTGDLVWRYPSPGNEPLGPIKCSAAYDDGVVYFASTDMHAYALNASTGSLVWRSNKLPGESFQSFWPVIYRDKVVLSGSYGYRLADPGTYSVHTCDYLGETVDCYDFVNGIERDDIFPPESNPQPGDTIGPVFEANGQNGPWDWADGTNVMDGSRITEYFEDDGQVKFDRRANKPWRRTFFVLNKSDGTEYTFDSDGDGNPEYAPILYFGTKSGNAYPPVVMPNDVIYQNSVFEYRGWISGGQVMGWKLGTPFLGFAGGVSAVDEPQSVSGGGNLLYRSLCCDRVGSSIADITDPGFRGISYWDYSWPLDTLAPDYDMMWTIFPGYPRLDGYYKGNYDSVNGVYHNVGDQNPIVPYRGRLYIHRSNAVVAFAPQGSGQQLPLLEINEVQDDVPIPGTADLKSRLSGETQAIIQAGHLRPGYHNSGQHPWPELQDYFDNPGATLYTLAQAYPHLNPTLQQQVETYLHQEYTTYFSDTMVARIGWADGASREYMDLPPEVEDDLMNYPDRVTVGYHWSWSYPQHNLYALWKYAQLFPQNAVDIYQKAKSKLEVPVSADDQHLVERPWEHNAYIAGYIGFLELQELAGKEEEDIALRYSVQQELDRLLTMRAAEFKKDNPWQEASGGEIHRRKFNLAGNFMFLVPELGHYLHEHALPKIVEAVEEYNYVGPYWFVSSYEGTYQEGVIQQLFDYHGLFLAKAYALQEPREELVKYLDVPAFARGDLLYIQNLVAAIEAPHSLEKTAFPTSGNTGDPITYTLSFSGSDAMLLLTDTLPAGLGAPSNFELAGTSVLPIYDEGQHHLTWTDTPSAGQEVIIRYSATIATEDRGVLVNTAELHEPAAEPQITTSWIIANPWPVRLPLVARND